MNLEKDEINRLEKKYKISLINSITGIKPANLIGTRSKKGNDNVAIFSSVVHLGSNPPLIGMITRPQSPHPKDSYTNIMDTGYYTINHVSQSFIKKAHYTSAKLKSDVSEFDVMNLERAFLGDFFAPFVRQSTVKIGMEHKENISLPNGCIMIIGEVVLINLPDAILNEQAHLDLSSYDCVGISGLNTYYSLNNLESFPIVREHNLPDFNE